LHLLSPFSGSNDIEMMNAKIEHRLNIIFLAKPVGCCPSLLTYLQSSSKIPLIYFYLMHWQCEKSLFICVGLGFAILQLERSESPLLTRGQMLCTRDLVGWSWAHHVTSNSKGCLFYATSPKIDINLGSNKKSEWAVIKFNHLIILLNWDMYPVISIRVV